MLLKDAIRNRHSIRKFEKCEIKDEDIQLILEAAMMAPNAKNRRPWNFVVVSNREVLNTFPTLLLT